MRYFHGKMGDLAADEPIDAAEEKAQQRGVDQASDHAPGEAGKAGVKQAEEAFEEEDDERRFPPAGKETGTGVR
jgi:hypothetical protein